MSSEKKKRFNPSHISLCFALALSRLLSSSGASVRAAAAAAAAASTSVPLSLSLARARAAFLLPHDAPRRLKAETKDKKVF